MSMRILKPSSVRWPPDWWLHLCQAAKEVWRWSSRRVITVPVEQPTDTYLRRIYGLRVLFVMTVTALLWAPVVSAERGALKDEGSAKGKVVFVKSNLISVEYESNKEEKSSKEIYIPIDEETEFMHLQGLNDLAPGDTVRVDYELTYDESDGKRFNFERRATKIALLRRATKGLYTTD